MEVKNYNMSKLFLLGEETKHPKLSSDYLGKVSQKGNARTVSVTFDIKKYHVHFDGIFKHVDMSRAFYAHLLDEHNPEPFEFLWDFDKLDILHTKEIAKEELAIVKEIVTKYIKNDAPKELNLSSTNKQGLLQVLAEQLNGDSWTLDVSPRAVLDAIVRVLILELKTDVFPRFVRGVHCAIVVLNNKTNSELLTLRTAIEYPYTDSDFVKAIVTDRDLEFMRSLAEDSFDWELVGSLNSKLNSFWSDLNPVPKVSFFKGASIAKFECIFPISFEKVLLSCIPGYEAEIFDPNVMRMNTVQYMTPDEYHSIMEKDGEKPSDKNGKRSLAIEVFDVKLPFPLTTPRKYPICTSLDYNPENKTLTMVHKPCEHPNWVGEMEKHDWTKKKPFDVYAAKTGGTTKKPCHFMADLQSYHIQALGDGKTSFKQIHVFDLFGWGSSRTLQKLAASDRGIGLRSMLLKHMEGKKENTLEEAKEKLSKDPLGRLLLDIDIKGLDLAYQNMTKELVSDKIEEKVDKIEVVVEKEVKMEEKKEEEVVKEVTHEEPSTEVSIEENHRHEEKHVDHVEEKIVEKIEEKNVDDVVKEVIHEDVSIEEKKE
jgi:hypothetical protein